MCVVLENLPVWKCKLRWEKNDEVRISRKIELIYNEGVSCGNYVTLNYFTIFFSLDTEGM